MENEGIVSENENENEIWNPKFKIGDYIEIYDKRAFVENIDIEKKIYILDKHINDKNNNNNTRLDPFGGTEVDEDATFLSENNLWIPRFVLDDRIILETKIVNVSDVDTQYNVYELTPETKGKDNVSYRADGIAVDNIVYKTLPKKRSWFRFGGASRKKSNRKKSNQKKSRRKKSRRPLIRS